jgi:peptide/nickel transport system substrate-binding protein/oligopeptide transport system substrate-binding protein
MFGRRAPLWTRWSALIGALAVLPGCGSGGSSQLSLVVIEEPTTAQPGGLDRPLAAQLTRAATAQGLVAFDEQGRVVPALADRWIVTDDGESYIFRLREGQWRNGDPLTARAAKGALDSAMRSVRRTPLGLDLGAVDEVRVMAGRVIEIRLHRPMPYFLQLLAQPELGLVHRKLGDGPMILERGGSERQDADRKDKVSRLTPIDPARLGLPEMPNWDERTRQLQMSVLPADQAVAQFNDGLVDLVLGGRMQDFPLSRSVGILRGTIQLDPVIGLFGLQVARDEGLLAEAPLREALAMAIDREALIAPFGLSGWTPTTRLISPGVEGDLQTNPERWTDLPLPERRATAAARVRAWAAAQDQTNTPRVSIWLPSGPGSDILFGRLAEDFGAIGVSAQRVDTPARADLRLVDDVARYPRPRWFLNRLSCAARSGLCDPAADALVAEAVQLDDAVRRNAMIAEAEARMTAANLFIPFGIPIRWSLVRGNVEGFASNTWGWHPLMPLAWQRR